MGLTYKAISWNRQKRIYDLYLLGLVVSYLVVFIGLQLIFFPEITAEALILRATGSLALIILHIILVIGPLSRIQPYFLPLLYNRRHLGVTMFLLASVHAGLSMFQFHALGDVNPIVSIFVSNPDYATLRQFPFHTLGFLAWLILLIMAASSHDYWLKNLGPVFWKSMHMMVYVAYGLLIMHVMLGIIQFETSPWLVGLMGVGMIGIIGLHVTAGIRENNRLRANNAKDEEGFYKVGRVGDIAEDCAKMIWVDGENIAVFKYDNKLSAINNVCKHQNGPLGEGKIVDGCVVCPWHGYQYRPEDGTSPPPFKEKVTTYKLKLVGDEVWVDPKPQSAGTFVEPLAISSSTFNS